MSSADSTATHPAGALYRLVWRWHFYAGLICLPFFVLLATTGALYLFRDELSLIVEQPILVAADKGPSLPADTLLARAAGAQPGTPVRFTPPPAPGRSAEVGIRDEHHRIIGVFLDPASGRVLGKVADEDRPMKVISRIHSLDILGPLPNLVIEVVAGWAILLVVSGVFLWWPRGRRAGVVTVRGRPSQRLWWRDVHAVTGVFTAAVFLFLAVTGMPWSGFWGKNFREIVNATGLGMPAGSTATSVASDTALAAVHPGSWTMDAAATPMVTPREARPLPVAAVLDIARKRGLAPGYVVRLPASPGGVYTLQRYPRQATGQRVIHVDQYSGKVLADVGFDDYGPVSKATEWGIAVHTGGQYGLVNQLVMLAGCLAILTLSVAGAVMWWRRRPSGSLAAPQPAGPARLSAFALIALALGLIFPLLGLSILAALAIDRLVPAALKSRHAL
jgi:uncharacterized iron-regulated membrane protein